MKISQIIFLGLALFLTVKNTAGHHLSNCGLGPGVDACSCSEVTVRAARPIRPVKFADPYVIREASHLKNTPVQGGCGSLNPPRHVSGPSVVDLLKPSCGPIAPKFRPVGDLCSCTAKITDVTPAYPGRPICRNCAKKCDCPCNDEYAPRPQYTSFSTPNPELSTFEDDGLSFDEQENIYNAQCVPAAPADPVSLSLAFGLARKAHGKNIPEGSLAFGPKSAPIDGSIRKTAVDIPEERLLTVERPVVELKISRPRYSANYEEILAQQEALEQQRIELEAQNPEPQAAFISYRDLGYAPVAPSKPNFISTQGSQPELVDDSACGPVGPALPGYVSGNVIVRSEVTQENDGDYDNYGDDGSYEQDFDPYSNYSSEEAAPSDGNSGLLARLRASAHAQRGPGCGAPNCGSGCGCGH